MTDEGDTPPKRQWTLDISPRADADIENILLYTTQRWGSAQRTRYRRVLTRALRDIERYPRIGTDRADLIDDARSLTVNEHVIYYRLIATRILVLRVLHSRQDAVLELS